MGHTKTLTDLPNEVLYMILGYVNEDQDDIIQFTLKGVTSTRAFVGLDFFSLYHTCKQFKVLLEACYGDRMYHYRLLQSKIHKEQDKYLNRTYVSYLDPNRPTYLKIPRTFCYCHKLGDLAYNRRRDFQRANAFTWAFVHREYKDGPKKNILRWTARNLQRISYLDKSALDLDQRWKLNRKNYMELLEERRKEYVQRLAAEQDRILEIDAEKSPWKYVGLAAMMGQVRIATSRRIWEYPEDNGYPVDSVEEEMNEDQEGDDDYEMDEDYANDEEDGDDNEYENYEVEHEDWLNLNEDDLEDEEDEEDMQDDHNESKDEDENEQWVNVM